MFYLVHFKSKIIFQLRRLKVIIFDEIHIILTLIVKILIIIDEIHYLVSSIITKKAYAHQLF